MGTTMEDFILFIMAAMCCLATTSVYAQTMRREHPLCVMENCGPGTECRVIRTCTTANDCSLRASCLGPDNQPAFSHKGVCQVGNPILEMRDGVLVDVYCGSNMPCPKDHYCNSELQDTYSTCCRSDPEPVSNPGVCPTSKDNGYFYCVDSCINDGDCRGPNSKCCQSGCRKECIFVDPCDNITCPQGSYCRRSGQPCSLPSQCGPEGTCIQCGPLCRKHCPFGNVQDPNGCPICTCKPGPAPPKPVVPVPPNPTNVLTQTNQQTTQLQQKQKTPQTGCGPLCRMYCKHGNVLDQNGCPICKCKPAPVAVQPVNFLPINRPVNVNPPTFQLQQKQKKAVTGCGPLCRMYCHHGNVLDQNGCPICKCKPAPVAVQPVNFLPINRPVNVNPPTFQHQHQQQHQQQQQQQQKQLTKPFRCGPLCMMYCKHGNVLDQNGCPICKCKPGPATLKTVNPLPPSPKPDKYQQFNQLLQNLVRPQQTQFPQQQRLPQQQHFQPYWGGQLNYQQRPQQTPNYGMNSWAFLPAFWSSYF